MEMEDDGRVVIRDAREDDAPALAMLATAMDHPSDEAAMRRRMALLAGRDEYRTLVAEREGRVVGMAALAWGWTIVDDDPQPRVVALSVAPEERGRGTGAALMAAAEAWARDGSAATLRLTTAVRREGAHRFYERLGYARTGFRYVKKLG
ncbi:GNAT family N-acetyltransferase [Longimicrobium sp.]|uniref:GNAT family N-acetyltransferase n=1 Tax=Longimicrobium sp. TaxID=2029185 RepID=UPI002CF18492|nr:GNAT family N-acetyltransferase [Longimicrobium sp.]HSU16057.1 GNAT family N-acetyltransferase [Longimicrobium sp.]